MQRLFEIKQNNLPTETGEFWTAKQRAGHPIHEVSYRACFKPQLPAYFIRRHGASGGTVYDPFMGRGTTLIEAQLHGCRAVGNDANPLCKVLAAPRLNPPALSEIQERLKQAELLSDAEKDAALHEDLLAFFHEETLREIYGWRAYFRRRTLDAADAWIQMVACGRLTGHSPGFFSVYTLPPNLAASPASQRKINARRGQTPEYRDTRALILRKSKALLRRPLPAHYRRGDALLLTGSADASPQLPDESVDLVVTSPPFLDTVDYMRDNWLRMWFCGLEPPSEGSVWQLRSLSDWTARMVGVFAELRRTLKADGLVAFEVGEVRGGSVLLEEAVVRAALEGGLSPSRLLINAQRFTKTANCWGVSNNRKGTNSNRIVVLRRESSLSDMSQLKSKSQYQ